MALFTLKTRWDDLQKKAIEQNACIDAMDYYADLMSVNPDLTIEEAIAQSPAEASIRGPWFVWACKVLFDEMDTGVRKSFYQGIDDPMMALCILVGYLKESKDLPDDEKIILETKFKDKLRLAEKEYADGDLTLGAE